MKGLWLSERGKVPDQESVRWLLSEELHSQEYYRAVSLFPNVPIYVLFSLLLLYLLTPGNSPSKKIFQEGCQRKLLNEKQGQHESRVEEGDKGTIQKLSPGNWGKSQSNTTGRDEGPEDNHKELQSEAGKKERLVKRFKTEDDLHRKRFSTARLWTGGEIAQEAQEQVTFVCVEVVLSKQEIIIIQNYEEVIKLSSHVQEHFLFRFF